MTQTRLAEKAQTAAFALIETALKWAERGGHTSIILGKEVIQTHCARVFYPIVAEKQAPGAIFDSLAWNALILALGHQPRGACQVAWSKLEGPAPLICLSLLVHDAMNKERALLESIPRSFGQPSSSENDNDIILLDLDPLEITTGKDIQRVAEEVMRRDLFSVTIVTLRAYFSKTRKAAVYAALRDLGVLDENFLPPYVTFEEMVEKVPAQRRRYLIVDQAHFLGTEEHTMWLKQRQSGISLIGSVYISPSRPGITLAHLFPLEPRLLQGEAGLRIATLTLLYEVCGDWLTNATTGMGGPTSLAMTEAMRPRNSKECVFFCDEHGSNLALFKRLRQQHGSERILTAAPRDWSLLCMEMVKRPEYTYRMVITQTTLERLTLHEWLLFLLVTPAGISCSMVGELLCPTPAKELHIFLKEIIQLKASYMPRRIAGVQQQARQK